MNIVAIISTRAFFVEASNLRKSIIHELTFGCGMIKLKEEQ